MKRKTAVLFLLVIAMSILIFSGAGTAQDPQKETVKIMTKKGIGSYLAGSNGKALYYFKKDGSNKSMCSGDCLAKWEIYCYKPDQIEIDKGLKDKNFGSFYRTADSQDQLTYKGKPLYNYAEDGPGDTKGNGIDRLWHLVKP